MGLSLSAQGLSLPNPDRPDDGSFDFIVKLEKAEDELAGYTIEYIRNGTLTTLNKIKDKCRGLLQALGSSKFYV